MVTCDALGDSIPKALSVSAMTGTVQGLGLIGDALEVATETAAKFPVTFTNGRRLVVDQARAMSQNILASGKGSGWISATYVPSAARQACIDAVDGLTHPHNHDNLTTAIGWALAPMTDAERAQLSRHFGGGAYDLRPQVTEPWWPAMVAFTKEECRARGGKVLTEEGGLVRFHVEFPLLKLHTADEVASAMDAPAVCC